MTRVLLVDDDMNFRRSLAISLETEGWHVYEAGSGMEALEILQVNQKTVTRIGGVVVDARMPGLDGFWLADQITAKYPSTRVVLLLAHAYSPEIRNYEIFTKPVSIPILVKALE